jgi:hypothetical protein
MSYSDTFDHELVGFSPDYRYTIHSKPWQALVRECVLLLERSEE